MHTPHPLGLGAGANTPHLLGLGAGANTPHLLGSGAGANTSHLLGLGAGALPLSEDWPCIAAYSSEEAPTPAVAFKR